MLLLRPRYTALTSALYCSHVRVILLSHPRYTALTSALYCSHVCAMLLSRPLYTASTSYPSLNVARALGDYYMILDEYKIIYSNTFIVQLYNVYRITYLIRLLVLNRDLLFLFDHDLHIRWCSCRLTLSWRVSLVKHELFTHGGTWVQSVSNGVHFAQSLVFVLHFINHCLYICVLFLLSIILYLLVNLNSCFFYNVVNGIELNWILVFNATFSNISAISWRPVLVIFITCGCEPSAPFFVIYKAGREPMPYWW